MTEYTVGRIEQLTRAHKSARPKHENIAWVNTHRDLGIALEEISRLSAENSLLKRKLAAIEPFSRRDTELVYEDMGLVFTEQTPVCPETAIQRDCSHMGDHRTEGGMTYCDDCGVELL